MFTKYSLRSNCPAANSYLDGSGFTKLSSNLAHLHFKPKSTFICLQNFLLRYPSLKKSKDDIYLLLFIHKKQELPSVLGIH